MALRATLAAALSGIGILQVLPYIQAGTNASLPTLRNVCPCDGVSIGETLNKYPIADNFLVEGSHHCPWIGQCVGWRNHKVRFSALTS